MRMLLLATAMILTLATGCTRDHGPELWIYTSVYPHVVQQMRTKVAAAFPGVKINWYQGGSESVAAKINTELLSGHTRADLIMSSDLFWYEDLKAKKALLPYDSSAAARVPAQFRDPDHTWCASRVPVMIIAYNSEAVAPADVPHSWAELALPKYKDKVAMPSPLESGTTFTAVALIQKKLGWEFFEKLRANGAISAGGNSSVMAKLVSKERPIGMVLLENVLTIRKKNQKIVAVYPAEGPVTVPSPVAISAGTRQPELAKKVYDYFFGREMQVMNTEGDMYAIFTDVPPPPGAAPWDKVMAQSMPWNRELLNSIRANRENIKERFAEIMLE